MSNQIIARHARILEERGLDLETLVRLGVASSDRPGGDWVVIPFVQAGRVVNHKYRTISGDKRFVQDQGAVKCFWNFDVITDSTLADQPLVITEGEFDALAAIQSGFPRTVSVPDGAPVESIANDNESRKYSYILDALPALRDVKEIILATDCDGPGINLLNDLAVRLGKTRCKWIGYPKTKGDKPPCKDLNDVLRLYGQKGVAMTLHRAQWIRVDGFYRMSELPPMPVQEVFRIGMPVLDNHYRIRPGDFTVVTGIPSHGKSSFLTDIACRMATNHGWTTAFASFEQAPQIDHRRSLRTWFGKKQVRWQGAGDIEAADAWIDRYFSFICPSDDDDVTLSWVLEKASAAVIQHGAKMVIIDPWNEMDHSRPNDMSLTEYTGFAIKEFKRFARRHQAHVIVAAHPAKMRPENGKMPIPTLYDISDSAHWANKCDAGIVVWRGFDKFDNPITKIRIAKSRYHDQIGTPGDVDVRFDPDSNRYEAIDTGRSLLEGDAA